MPTIPEFVLLFVKRVLGLEVEASEFLCQTKHVPELLMLLWAEESCRSC